EESQRQQLVRYLSILQHLGPAHLHTINSFVQKNISSSGQQGGADDLHFDGDARSNQHSIISMMALLDRASEEQVDVVLSLLRSQIRGPLDMSDVQRLQGIANQLRVPVEHVESLGRLEQAHLFCEVLTLHLSEDHLTKITDALTAVFPLSPNEDPINTNANTLINHQQQQNYLIILQKLQQLFTTSRLDSILHLHQELNQQGIGFSIAHQQICETLDLKPDEYYLATALKSLLQIEESSLISLFEAFPKLQSLQLAQIAQLPYRSIYEVYDLRANLCSLVNTYQLYSGPTN
ncbi:hypothetical protein SAMD00019534_039820, partial [Acytostelium subglobosum LB1]|uniref:hypothetical protein n=1 Tax=Acytostelium subglobosum LB1 TaxID=1410327 RepID=UPI000644D6FF